MSTTTPRKPLSKAAIAATSLALAATSALGFAARADAGPHTFRPGVVEGNFPSGPEFAAMRNIRARSVRTVFRWDTIEVARRTGDSCATAQYNFAGYDPVVAAAGQHRVSILAVLGGSPQYVEPNSNLRHDSARYPAPGTRAFGDFQCFVRALVRRYGAGGTFPARDIIDWQLWNEPNLPLYSPRRQVSPAKYGKFVKGTAGSIRGPATRSTLVLGGLPEQSPDGMNSNVFLRRMYRVNRVRSRFDVVALHPYSRNALGTKGALIRLRETLRDLRDRRRAVWVTEVGYATDGPKRYFSVTTEKGQADKFQSTFRMFRSNRDRFNLGSVYWYGFRDLATYAQNTGNWTHYVGLYRKDGTPKPSCARYKRFTGAPGGCPRIQDGGSSTSLSSTGDLLFDAKATVAPSPPE